jgi:hypothetical protein
MCRGWIKRVVMLLAGLWFVNLTNFTHGLDWITVDEFVPITAGLTVLVLIAARRSRRKSTCRSADRLRFINGPVVRLFLDDVGILRIGLMIV